MSDSIDVIRRSLELLIRFHLILSGAGEKDSVLKFEQLIIRDNDTADVNKFKLTMFSDEQHLFYLEHDTFSLSANPSFSLVSSTLLNISESLAIVTSGTLMVMSINLFVFFSPTTRNRIQRNSLVGHRS